MPLTTGKMADRTTASRDDSVQSLGDLLRQVLEDRGLARQPQGFHSQRQTSPLVWSQAECDALPVTHPGRDAVARMWHGTRERAIVV